ncbi:MAG TPA: single-stranded-DNA-specific exonuclease RecJ [Candidatus Saccharimonadales bacterium]|nr:single-stranded-DNA-specific exonuclease RecJ [Candidatus Saccharimonadales bacterium]
MLEPRFRWTFPDPSPSPSDLLSTAAERGLSSRMAGLLASRGVTSSADVGAWFADPLDGLHDPRLLPDAGILLARLTLARERDERVMVFGDFDADGLDGLAILVLAFRRFGLVVEPYVPSRLDEGHGLSLAALDAAERTGSTVIVTVDCGTSSGPEIAAAALRGIDVLVTDHHRVPPELPPALAVVNPHRADSTYPDDRLAGSGVAFKVAQLLLADLPGGPAAALELADLATIGTVADVAPIVGENRAIARLGLALLRTSPRPGIAALLERARVATSAVDLDTISFALAPRLNAAGRVGEALEAARLLLADDAATAAVHADALEAANQTRRDLMTTAVADARAIVDTDPDRPASIVRGPWPVGIVGLVASRLVDDRSRPAVVGAELGDTIRASCRSDGTVDLGAALEACADLFIRYGGHAGAAGFEIATERWATFIERFEAVTRQAVPPDPRAAIRIDVAVPALDVDYALHRELASLAPYGPGNPEPLVAVLGLTVTRVRLAGADHASLTLKRRLDVLDGIAFGRSDLAETIAVGDRIDVVARVTSRSFGGYESLQLEIRDAARSGAHAEAATILGLDAVLPAPMPAPADGDPPVVLATVIGIPITGTLDA